MADLDLAAAASMFYDFNDVDVTSSELDLVPAIASGHAAEVDGITISNVDGTNADSVTITRYKSATGVPIAKTLVVPAGSVLVYATKQSVKRLNEGDKITVQGVAASGDLTASADWKDFS